MNLTKKIVAAILGASVVIFTSLSILSIWDILHPRIAWKSISTLGVVFFASLLVLAVLKILESADYKSKKQ